MDDSHPVTRVVNLRKEPFDVYIGRPGKGVAGPLGNPIIVGKQCQLCSHVHMDGGSTLPCYEKYLWWRCDVDLEFRRLVESCLGKTLGCFCHPKPCHGNIIVKYLSSHVRE